MHRDIIDKNSKGIKNKITIKKEWSKLIQTQIVRTLDVCKGWDEIQNEQRQRKIDKEFIKF